MLGAGGRLGGNVPSSLGTGWADFARMTQHSLNNYTQAEIVSLPRDGAPNTCRMLWRSTAPVRHPPGFIEPCLPTNGHAPTGPQWAYEIKHDLSLHLRRNDQARVLADHGR